MSAPVTDLLDVFSTYDGAALFRGLAEGADGQPPVLARVGWLFTGGGALFVLWGFVLRSQRGGAEDKLGEIAKTLLVLGALVGGSSAMQATMTAADSLYAHGPGDPQRLAYACAKAAYALPEVTRLFDVLGRDAVGPGAAPPTSAVQTPLITQPDDGSFFAYVEAHWAAVKVAATEFSDDVAREWNGAQELISLATGLGAGLLKCELVAVTIIPVYLLFLVAAALVWFMMQLRFFLAVAGTMMLPLFIGMFSMPAGHFSRSAAQNYVTRMVALALWPVAWAIGHTGTVVLYDVLISLMANTGRVPGISALLQWNAITGGVPTEVQLQAIDTSLGNWYMGNLSALLAILVGGVGFVIWVGAVTVLGPVALHRMLASGAAFVSELAQGAGRYGAAAGRMAGGMVENRSRRSASLGTAPLPGPEFPLGQQFTGLWAVRAGEPDAPAARGATSMAAAAHWIDVSSSQSDPAMQN